MNLLDIKKAVETTLTANIKTKNRKRSTVDSKIIFFLMSKTFTKERVGVIMKMTGRNHSIASHYRKTGMDLLNFDKEFKVKYINCLKAINTKEEEIQQLIKTEYLQTIIYK